MEYTADVKMRLEALKNKFYLAVTGDWTHRDVDWTDRDVNLESVCGWKTETVPEKKKPFGHPAYIELTEIHVLRSIHKGTKYVRVYSSPVEDTLCWIEKGRELFVKLKEDIDKFGFDVTKKERPII